MPDANRECLDHVVGENLLLIIDYWVKISVDDILNYFFSLFFPRN